MSMRRILGGLIVLAVWLSGMETSSACAVCFGNAESPLTQAVGWGIISLLGVVMVVLGGIVAFFIYLARRSSLAAAESGSSQSVQKTINKA